MWALFSLITLSPESIAQGIGTWSAQRSPEPLASSPDYDALRARLREEYPSASLVPLHSLSGPVLALLDALVLDGAGDEPLSREERAALVAFVEAGGVLLADASGPTGASVAEAFGVSVRGPRHVGPHVDVLPEGTFDGPAGKVGTFGTAGTEHLRAPPDRSLSVGHADGAHLVSLRPGRGRAVFVGGMSAFTDGDAEPPGRFSDNAALLSNLIAAALPAPRVGTWSGQRSEIGFATSDAFERVRARLRVRMPGLQLVELDALTPSRLAGLDAVLLDSTPAVPPAAAEIDALRSFVAGGGAVVAQLHGAAGQAIAALYDLAIIGAPTPTIHELPVTAGVASTALSGPFGTVSRYANRYEASIGTTKPNTEAVPLVQGPDGTHVVYVPATTTHGSALLLTNLFAFGDADWSVGGLAEGANDNVALLGNFLAGTVRHGAAPLPASAGWQPEYVQAASAAVRGDMALLGAWRERYGDQPDARAVADHVARWLAGPPDGVDPRFFPVDGILLGSTTRKDLRKGGRKPNRESKWTFDIGDLTWTCLEDRQDLCDLVRVRAELPPAWSAAGLRTTATPEQLLGQFDRLGYKVELGFASESPFGRQVVARGFGVLWQADYSLREDGERLLSLTARRAR